ncbi:E3 UFM1-protein ligase 1 homolog [Ischnura elegans]|uniref:E3 UFM1-protein ligase 1 homolog n=1 Tax=Ischnura elegans TaxID=197161 RepID=UPI001ED8A743|nr:E3 UFM1-protein ligase 1 homolog [Ischnura elegans]
MAAVDWNEIKRLAADFQRAQLSCTVQRLSENNCIEIVSRLLELKLLDVLFTTDGKEYVTPQHLTKEILDELYVHGGRINLVELAKLLSVDLSQVEARVNELSSKDGRGDYTVILGQLIDKSYQTRVAQEINDCLQREGQVSISSLTRNYDLPGEFLQTLVERELGKTIDGKQDKQDPRLIFTEAFVARNRAIVRGALCAVTRPTTVASIISQCKIPESIFYSVVEGLLEKKQVAGSLSGKQGPNSLYVPSVYSKSQSDWVNSFFRQNGYLEYDALRRLGISDPAGFVKKHNFPGEAQPQCLATCAIGKSMLEHVEAAVDEAIATGSWVDIEQILPSVFSPDDVSLLLTKALKNHDSGKFLIFCQSFVVTEPFLKSLAEPLEAIALKRAEESVASGAYLQAQLESGKMSGKGGFSNSGDGFGDDTSVKGDRREERRKKATGGKGGGGTQGRETKTKSTKKKHYGGKRGGGDSDDDEDEGRGGGKGTSGKANKAGLEFLRLSEVQEKLQEHGEQENKAASQAEFLQDASPDLISEIASFLHPSIQRKAEAAARNFLETAVASSAQSRRKIHAELQERLSALLTDVRLYERGAKLIDNNHDDGSLGQFSKHLLRTMCTDIANEIFDYASKEGSARAGGPKEITTEIRVKILNEVTPQVREILMKLHKSLSGNSIEEFLATCEGALTVCDVVLRKQDKKKEKVQMQAHRSALLEKLNAVTDDPALALHLASLVLFQAATGQILHASGKFVPSILSFLRPHLQTETNATLQSYYDSVLKLLTMSSSNNDGDEAGKQRAEVVNSLINGLPGIKEIACNFKKSSAVEKQAAALQDDINSAQDATGD